MKFDYIESISLREQQNDAPLSNRIANLALFFEKENMNAIFRRFKTNKISRI